MCKDNYSSTTNKNNSSSHGNRSTGTTNTSNPLRCHPSGGRSGRSTGRAVFVVDSFITTGETSWRYYWGEAYTARQRVTEDHFSCQLYHLLHVRFEASRTSLAGTEVTAAAASVVTPAETEALKAVGRAAMAGFHTGLAGAMVDLAWGPQEVTIVVDAVPSECSTLGKALTGALYRENRSCGGSGSGGSISDGVDGAEKVVYRMLAIAKQMANAIAHCHRRGVSIALSLALLPCAPNL